MSIPQLILEYIKVLLSVQVVAGVVCFAILCIFRDDLRALLLRIAKIRFPGGAEVSTPQTARREETAAGAAKLPSPPEEEVKLPVTLQPDEAEKILELFQAERAKAYLWEYRYLNLFLAFNTQKVLDWLASLPSRTSSGLADAFWLPYIPRPEERSAIITALQAHYLIMIEDDLISVTPKGKEYIEWRGALPEKES